MNVITITLTVAIGSTMGADSFLTFIPLEIIFLGLVAFVFGTGSGVVTAKIMNLFMKEKINPLIGSAGIASVPIAARVSHVVANKENPENFLIITPSVRTWPACSERPSLAASCSRCSEFADEGHLGGGLEGHARVRGSPPVSGHRHPSGVGAEDPVRRIFLIFLGFLLIYLGQEGRARGASDDPDGARHGGG